MKSRLLLLLLLLVAACDTNDELTEEDLNVYVDRFYQEAASRNVTLPEKASLTVKFVDANEIKPYAGYGTFNPPLVRIVKSYWENYSPVQKEILMFHELGHALLRRVHTNEKLPNCLYKSMMFDGNQFEAYESETSEKRKYYIDELFNPFTPYPAWGGTIKTNRTRVVEDFINEPMKWTFQNFLGATHVGSVDNEVYFSAPSSLRITSPAPGKGMAQWHLSVPFKDFPTGSTIVLSFKIKTQNTVGVGAYAFLEAVPAMDRYFNTNTLNYAYINGTRDWTEMQLILNCYPGTKPDMSVDLYLDGASTGQVWFDDVRVDYLN